MSRNQASQCFSACASASGLPRSADRKGSVCHPTLIRGYRTVPYTGFNIIDIRLKVPWRPLSDILGSSKQACDDKRRRHCRDAGKERPIHPVLSDVVLSPLREEHSVRWRRAEDCRRENT